MHCSLVKFTLVPNSVFLFWKQSILEFLLSIAETFRCSVSPVQIKIVLLLDALQLLMFVGTLAYFEPKLTLLIIRYSDNFLIIKMQILFNK
jgi:hypothetical protein